MDAIYAILPRGKLEHADLIFKNGVHKVAKKPKIKKKQDEEFAEYENEDSSSLNESMYSKNGRKPIDKTMDEGKQIDFEA